MHRLVKSSLNVVGSRSLVFLSLLCKNTSDVAIDNDWKRADTLKMKNIRQVYIVYKPPKDSKSVHSSTCVN